MQARTGRIFIVFIFLMAAMNSSSFSQGILYADRSVKVYNNNKLLDNAWAGGISSGQFGMIDFTGDGIKDLAEYDRSSNMLNLYRYDSGRYLYAPEYKYLFPADLYGFVVFRDYNHDGFTDIFTSGKQGLKAYRNTGSKGGLPEFVVASDPVYTLTTSGRINLQVNYTDIPSIDDIDGDGDLDVLVYNFALGKSIRYHKNMSMEKFGNPDSLDFELAEQEWGQFQECECNMFAFTSLGQSCDMFNSHARTKHIGGKSLLLIDMDEDGVQDLLLGHDECSELYYFPNTGTKDQALMTSYSIDFPDSVNPADFPLFPAGYYDDFDNDGIKDLIVSPNDETNVFKNIDYSNSVWFYKNTGKNDLPSFHLSSKNFLQDGMIDVGENAKPLLMDADGDGDLDLLVAGNGHEENGTYYGYVTLYENYGNTSFPEFRLADKDFLGLSSWHLFDMYIGSADLNGDGSIDLFVSGINPAGLSVDSKIIYNNASRNSAPQFDAAHPEVVNIPLEAGDTPCFTDVDNDGHVDLLIGRYTGRLDYFRNLSDGGSPVFVLKQNDYLGITDSFFEFRKYLVPWVADIDLDGNEDLVTSDYLGDLFVYRDFRNKAVKQQLEFYNPLLNGDEVQEQGDQTWITSGRLFKNKYPVILLGNKQGGLTFFRQDLPGNSDNENNLVISIYPNPVNVNLAVNFKSSQSGHAIVFNSLGQPVSPVIPITANRALPFDATGLPQGLYIVKMTDIDGRVASAKFIVHH